MHTPDNGKCLSMNRLYFTLKVYFNVFKKTASSLTKILNDCSTRNAGGNWFHNVTNYWCKIPYTSLFSTAEVAEADLDGVSEAVGLVYTF